MGIYNIEVKIVYNTEAKALELSEVVDLIKGNTTKGPTSYIETSNIGVIEGIGSVLDCEVRKGVSEGCYGARTGNSIEGYTLWVELNELPKSWLDSYDLEEVINPLHGIEAYEVSDEVAELLIGDLDSFNTYNYENNYSYDIVYCRVDSQIVAFKAHCGGDIRGNYTSWYLAELDQFDEVI